MKFILIDRAIRVDSLHTITCNTVENAVNVFITCNFTEREINIMVPQYTEDQYEMLKTATLAVNSAILNSSEIIQVYEFIAMVQENFFELMNKGN